MLGGYTLTYDDKPITLGRGNLTKSVQLLQLLLLHIQNGIAKEELVQALYDWEDVTDTNNSLNSMIYRLKNQLAAAGMPKEDYISIKNGICRWSGSMPVEIDVVSFENYVNQAAEAKADEKRELLKNAVALYRGEFLPQLSNELWVTVESVRLKKCTYPVYNSWVRFWRRIRNISKCTICTNMLRHCILLMNGRKRRSIRSRKWSAMTRHSGSIRRQSVCIRKSWVLRPPQE